MEKATKEKRLQEAAVVKTKDKYKSDCVNINGLTAQTALTQGKDLDKVRRRVLSPRLRAQVQYKLDKHEQTVQINRTEYKHCVDALKATTRCVWHG